MFVIDLGVDFGDGFIFEVGYGLVVGKVGDFVGEIFEQFGIVWCVYDFWVELYVIEFVCFVSDCCIGCIVGGGDDFKFVGNG